MEVKRLQAVTTAARTALWKARAPRAVAAVARAKRQHQAVARAVNAVSKVEKK